MSDIPAMERHGLRIMRERAELLDADFQVTSQEDKGTEIIVRLPIAGYLSESPHMSEGPHVNKGHHTSEGQNE